MSKVHTSAAVPVLSQFELEPNPDRARESAQYVSDVTARFSGVPTLDVTTGAHAPVDYFVAGNLYREGERLQLRQTGIFAVDRADWPLDTGYRFRPGLRNTVGMARAIADRLHQEFPSAQVLEFEGRRGTDGFIGKREQRARFVLGDGS